MIRRDSEIVDASLSENIYTIEAENKSGSSAEIRVWINGMIIDHVQNGTVSMTNGNIYTIQVDFPCSGRKYSLVPVKIYLR